MPFIAKAVMKLSREAQGQALDQALRACMPAARILTDPLSLLAYGTDASSYRLIPQFVLKAHTLEEVMDILRLCAQYGRPLTFRAAGTSLSGQALTDSVLVMIGQGWKTICVHCHGEKITLGPAVTGGDANRALGAYGRKIGPDPASLE